MASHRRTRDPHKTIRRSERTGLEWTLPIMLRRVVGVLLPCKRRTAWARTLTSLECSSAMESQKLQVRPITNQMIAHDVHVRRLLLYYKPGVSPRAGKPGSCETYPRARFLGTPPLLYFATLEFGISWDSTCK